MKWHRRAAGTVVAVLAFGGSAIAATGSSAGAGGRPTTATAAPGAEPSWVVVGAEADCPDVRDFADTVGFRRRQITRFDAVCVEVGEEESVAVEANLVDDGTADGSTDDREVRRLLVDPDFDWTPETPPPAQSARFSLESVGPERAVQLEIRPEVGLEITFAAASGDLRTVMVESATRPESGSGSEVGDEPADPDATAPSSSLVEAVVLGASPIRKTVSVVGRDRGIDGLYVREQVHPSQMRAVVDGEARAPEADSATIGLQLDNGSVTYRLELIPVANFGRIQTVQQSELIAGNEVLAATSRHLLLDAPQIEIEIEPPGDVDGGASTTLTVNVSNRDARPILDPMTLTLRPTQETSLVTITDADGGELDGTTVSWDMQGLSPEDDFTRTVRLEFGSPGADVQIAWQSELIEEGAETARAVGSATTVIAGPKDSNTATLVQFTPDQLIRLIAFVMAFALVAVIFGHRARRSDEEQQTDSARAAELDRFRAYTQAILVLVILVAILVLALRGSLTGESAGSLIGVIAGYALGNARGARSS